MAQLKRKTKKNGNIIQGKFKTYKKLPVRFKLSLTHIIIAVLLLGVILSAGSYTVVLAKEKHLQKLHSDTSEIKMNNNEIRTKVESSKSIYNIETKAASLNYLAKPEKVIEVTETPNKNIIIDKLPDTSTERVVSGY